MANSGITHIEFNNKGFEEILASDGCRNLVEEATNGIGNLANANNTRGGTGFATNVLYGSKAKRYVGFVSTTDDKSEQAESEEGALSRAKEEFYL